MSLEYPTVHKTPAFSTLNCTVSAGNLHRDFLIYGYVEDIWNSTVTFLLLEMINCYAFPGVINPELAESTFSCDCLVVCLVGGFFSVVFGWVFKISRKSDISVKARFILCVYPYTLLGLVLVVVSPSSATMEVKFCCTFWVFQKPQFKERIK